MTNLATTSNTIRLALALTVMAPVPLFAETLTARQMLAQAQTQAVKLPGEIKKPGTTELAKLEVGKADLGKAEPAKAEPAKAVDLVAPLPIIAPLAPIASMNPAQQSHPANGSAAATPSLEVAKPSIASVTVPPAPSAAAITGPVTAIVPPVTYPAVTPAPEKHATVTRPALAAPTTDAAPTELPAKTARPETIAKTSSKAPKEKVAARRLQGSRSEFSFDGGSSRINARMISRIMQRPEVQSLIAQYGDQ
jgi:hypothetical protein